MSALVHFHYTNNTNWEGRRSEEGKVKSRRFLQQLPTLWKLEMAMSPIHVPQQLAQQLVRMSLCVICWPNRVADFVFGWSQLLGFLSSWDSRPLEVGTTKSCCHLGPSGTHSKSFWTNCANVCSEFWKALDHCEIGLISLYKWQSISL